MPSAAVRSAQGVQTAKSLGMNTNMALRSKNYFYTWSGKGNLGDDWIASIAEQWIPRGTQLHEERSFSLRHRGGHRLVPLSLASEGDTLTLWGGGWLATDREGSDTMHRWRRHLSNYGGRVMGVGLGLGPFDHELELTHQVLSRIDDLIVRTAEDKRVDPTGKATLGADISFVDNRVTFSTEPSEKGYSLVSFPKFSDHWRVHRPWMTEIWYVAKVHEIVRQAQERGLVYFVDFQVGRNSCDSTYWKDLSLKVLRPRNVAEALELVSGSKQMLAGRLHAGLMAALSGVPTAALAYHHKFGCLEEIGVPTMGLVREPAKTFDAIRADPSSIQLVRERSVEILEAVRWSE